MRPNTYRPIQQVQDAVAIRATCFHPSGEAYVVGTNSKALKICKYPNEEKRRELLDCDGLLAEPEISFTCLHIHCASVYCANFNPKGNLLATGSNDRVVHIIRYNPTRHGPEGSEHKLSLHNGTVRDVCFLHGTDQGAEANLLSAGAGDCSIQLTDCNIMKSVQVFSGHSSTVMSLTTCEGSPNLFASGSLDGTIRIWDTRTKACAAMIMGSVQEKPESHQESPQVFDGVTSFDNSHHNGNLVESEENTTDNKQPNGPLDRRGRQHGQDSENPGWQHPDQYKSNSDKIGSSVGVVRLDPTGRLLVSGHKDGSCMLYDVRGGQKISSFQAHNGEIRTLSLSPNSFYLLTGGYDGRIKLNDLQGRLTQPLPCIEIAELDDKAIQVAWHPSDYNFVTTCANGSATLWTIPDFDDWRNSLVMESNEII